MTLLPGRRATRQPAPDGEAFEDLALPLIPALYNMARWLTSEAGDAEDLVQESLLKALKGFASFERGTNFRAWIYRILRNTWLTSRTGLAAIRTVALEDELAEEGEHGPRPYPEGAIDRKTPELDMIRLRDRGSLQSAMEKLPAHLLETVLLADVEELKYREVAVILGVPMGTVMSRLARARGLLRRELENPHTNSREVRK